MIKVFEAFSGYGSQSIALDRVGIDYEVVGISEIDKNAIKAYYALHSENIKNYGDICEINPKDLPKFDLFTYSFPCTDISLTGKMLGMDRGTTRSSLLYECEKIIDYCRPKYLLMENVKSLVGNRYKDKFDEWLKYLEKLGYSNQWFVLNAKDFGVPQSRERVFCLSVLNESINVKIETVELKSNIFDYLDIVEPEKYLKEYFTPQVHCFSNGAYRGRYNEDGKTVQQLELRLDNISNTITSVKKDNVVYINGVIRYLTEAESFRLMGLTENEIDKIMSVGIPKAELYKLAGNSIVVQVLEAIFKAWLK